MVDRPTAPRLVGAEQGVPPKVQATAATMIMVMATPRKNPTPDTPFDLLVHCGIRFLTFNEENYVALNPAPSPNRVAVSDTVSDNGYIHGYISAGLHGDITLFGGRSDRGDRR